MQDYMGNYRIDPWRQGKVQALRRARGLRFVLANIQERQKGRPTRRFGSHARLRSLQGLVQVLVE